MAIFIGLIIVLFFGILIATLIAINNFDNEVGPLFKNQKNTEGKIIIPEKRVCVDLDERTVTKSETP